MELFGWIPEILIALIHLLWIGGWWFFGHFIYLFFRGCTDNVVTNCSFMNFASEDFLAVITLLFGSVLFIRLGRSVLKAFGGNLPIESIVSMASKVVQGTAPNRKQRRQTQKRKKH